MHDSFDLYPIMLSSSALFRCAGPGVKKVKIVDLYEVHRYQRKYEESDEFKQKHLDLPSGSAPLAHFAYYNIPINRMMVFASLCSASLLEDICVRL